jgi:hypothetical protein
MHLVPEGVHITRSGAGVRVAGAITRVHDSHFVAVGIVLVIEIRPPPTPSTTSAVVTITSSRFTVGVTSRYTGYDQKRRVRRVGRLTSDIRLLVGPAARRFSTIRV